MDIARIWIACRGGDFSPGHLPAAGGVLDQPAWLMAALAIMDRTAAQARKGSGDGSSAG